MTAVGELQVIVLDCAEPRSLAAFYREVLGLDTLYESPAWVPTPAHLDIMVLAGVPGLPADAGERPRSRAVNFTPAGSQYQ